MNIRPKNIIRYEKAEKLFNEGKSLREIGKELNMDYRYISQYLKEKGYQIKRNQNWVKHDEEIMKQILILYNEGYNIKTLSEMFKVKDNRISQYLQKNGCNFRLNNQFHDYDVEAFKIIDTEEKAYWLGFISADGSITNGILELSLQASDKEHVEKFARFLSPTAEIRYRINTKSYRATICSKEICDDLISLGVTPNKSLTLEFCKDVPNNLLHHYMRGYIDGDGSIGLGYRNKNDKRKHASIEILGTKSFLDEVILSLNLHHNKKFMHGGAYSIRYSGNKLVPSILTKIYKDATVFLPRKYDKYKQIIDYCRLEAKVAR